jgi:hypothetical protein
MSAKLVVGDVLVTQGFKHPFHWKVEAAPDFNDQGTIRNYVLREQGGLGRGVTPGIFAVGLLRVSDGVVFAQGGEPLPAKV